MIQEMAETLTSQSRQISCQATGDFYLTDKLPVSVNPLLLCAVSDKHLKAAPSTGE